jgi:uncharacterized protein YggT (Ycf19 family)
MHIIDFMLNLAAWILWVNAWMQKHHSRVLQQPITLLATLKTSRREIREIWFYLGGCMGVLLIKALLLHYLGSPLNAAVSVDFMHVLVFFQTGSLVSMGLMALTSFLKFAFLAYLWVWFLWNLSREGVAEPIIGNLEMALGFLPGRHVLIQVTVLMLLGIGGWIGLGLMFGWVGILPSNVGMSQLIWQAIWISASAWLSLFWLILVLMILYLIHSYVYLGNWEGWVWVEGMGERLLEPFEMLPLQWARIDLSPCIILLMNGIFYLLGSRLVQQAYHAYPF